MALTLPCGTTEVMSLDDYLDYVHSRVKLTDVESLASSAPALRALANNRTLVVHELNARIVNVISGLRDPSAHTLVLGKGSGFYVRANIWPAMADLAGRAYQDNTGYNLAHDHNFTFLTVCHTGPGYETEIYEYDYSKVEGFVGEPVQLRFLEKVVFGPGGVMLYRQNKDVHVQYAPKELTITLNLMVHSELPSDQYHFDLARHVITSGLDPQATARNSLIGIAGYLGDAQTFGLLEELASKHPCRRTRLAAFEAISRRQPETAAVTWEKACADTSAFVSKTAKQRLRELHSN